MHLKKFIYAVNTTPMLGIPDFEQPFVIHCYASSMIVGAELCKGFI